MSRFGFCGGSYKLQNLTADCQQTMNFYAEADESQMGKSALVLNPTPGLSLFASEAGAGQVRGAWTINNRSFAVIDGEIYEVLANGTLDPVGSVANDGNPTYMVASPQQLAVASGGLLYVYYLQTVAAVAAGTFTPVPSATFPGPVDSVDYSDGFFVALIAQSQKYFVSTALDATSWPALQVNEISTFPDNVVAMKVDHRQIYLFGAKSSEADYDAGSSPVPFQAAPGGFMEEGCGAEFATLQVDNSIFWIGMRNDEGWGIAWRLNGYTPQRISTHAVEFAWSQYPTIADARAWKYREGGHKFWVINFPSGNATWAYDVATGLWAERSFFNQQTGLPEAALPQCHTFNFGKHLVGDRKSGNIYQMATPATNGGAWNFATDNGALIRRVRRAPYISTENQWIRHSYLWVDVMAGIGTMPPLRDGAGNPRAPKCTLSYSDDWGRTFSAGRDKGFGQAGNYKTRLMWRQLGRSRGRVYELSCAEPVPLWITDAYLQADGFAARKRLPKELAEAS